MHWALVGSWAPCARWWGQSCVPGGRGGCRVPWCCLASASDERVAPSTTKHGIPVHVSMQSRRLLSLCCLLRQYARFDRTRSTVAVRFVCCCGAYYTLILSDLVGYTIVTNGWALLVLLKHTACHGMLDRRISGSNFRCKLRYWNNR